MTRYRSNAMLLTVILTLLTGCATRGKGLDEPASAAATAAVAAATPAPATVPRTPVMATAQSNWPMRPQAALPTEIELRYGIQVTQVGMAAAGGLVDLRLKILDAAKARKILGDPANTPVLISGDAPPLAPPHHALHGVKLGDGIVYNILYPNVRSTVKAGSEVVVAMGDVRLGPVTVQ
jgi:hypothetical protein